MKIAEDRVYKKSGSRGRALMRRSIASEKAMSGTLKNTLRRTATGSLRISRHA
jgi:hypothetical protein